MAGFIVVRNPQPRLLPRVLRVFFGEEYLGVIDQRPAWVTDAREVRVFPSHAWADSYVHSMLPERKGAIHRHAAGRVVIRRTNAAHSIPLGEDESS